MLDRYAEMGNKDKALRAAKSAYEFSMQDTEKLELLESVLREKGLDK